VPLPAPVTAMANVQDVRVLHIDGTIAFTLPAGCESLLRNSTTYAFTTSSDPSKECPTPELEGPAYVGQLLDDFR
jgi:hypothetical protein